MTIRHYSPRICGTVCKTSLTKIFRFEIGNKAKTAWLELYDITGLCVFKTKMEEPGQGRNQFENLDLKKLGSDVYTARLKVKFESGKTKQKLYRVGVIR